MSDVVTRFAKVVREDDGFEVRCTIPGCGYSYPVAIPDPPHSLDELFKSEGAPEIIFSLIMEHGVDVHGMNVGEVKS